MSTEGASMLRPVFSQKLLDEMKPCGLVRYRDEETSYCSRLMTEMSSLSVDLLNSLLQHFVKCLVEENDKHHLHY